MLGKLKMLFRVSNACSVNIPQYQETQQVVYIVYKEFILAQDLSKSVRK
jgi:hypothetical protein